MIICVSPTTGVEYTWEVPKLQLGGVFRVRRQTMLASGKGANVARGALALGEKALGAGFVAGHTGRLFVELAEREGIQGEWVWVKGETRLALALYDPHVDLDATLISAPGPQVGHDEWAQLTTTLMRVVRPADLVCFSGSLPPGSPLQDFQTLIQKLVRAGAQVWVDTSGDPLRAAVDATPGGVKVNANEVTEAFGLPIGSAADILNAAAYLRQCGMQDVIITRGQQGAVWVSAAGDWQVLPFPLVGSLSSVGSGDAFMAGLLTGLARQEPPEVAFRMAAAAGAANTLCPGGGRFSFEAFETCYNEVQVIPL